MSSFVISKKEYIKAAGLVAGIASVKRDFFVFDYEAGHRMQESDFYKKFVDCFTMNALSVQEQYKDSDAWTDSNEYMTEYKDAKQKGINAAISNGLPDKMIQLKDFFDSAIYQTENECYSWKMKTFFNAIIMEVFDMAHPHECKSWGSLEI